ncbi:Primase C terminal 1 (PriCT-1) [Micrococcales bacterium KH10]|nr:Primase C terminal 1 (PriCT-1) [Micrococcales bacterium KH10]
MANTTQTPERSSNAQFDHDQSLWFLFASVAQVPLKDAARRFAAAGLPIFPLIPGGKKPVIKDGQGFHAATTDIDQVTTWWTRWPDANIGIPTGTVSGFDVVDVDNKATGSGFEAFNKAHAQGLVRGWAGLVRTPSGGMHAYYPVEVGREQPCWQSAKAHVDFRGAGGYIVAPPSRVGTTSGEKPYVLVAGPDTTTGPVDAAAVRQFLDPRPTPPPRPHPTAQPGRDLDQTVDRLTRWVRGLVEGERNAGLFWAACTLAEAGTSHDVTLDALLDAGTQIGLDQREVTTTVQSAYRRTVSAPTSTPRSPTTPARSLHRLPVGTGPPRPTPARTPGGVQR